MNHNNTFLIRFLIGIAISAGLMIALWIFVPHFFSQFCNYNMALLPLSVILSHGIFGAMLFENRSLDQAWVILVMNVLLVLTTFNTTEFALLVMCGLVATTVITSMILPYPRVRSIPSPRMARLSDDIF